MKKYIYPVIIASITFLIGIAFLTQSKIKPTEIILQYHVIAPINDGFQLFYMQEGDKRFTGKHSVKVRVDRSLEYQKIMINLPFDSSITRLRLDVGDNNRQSRFFKIRDIELTSETSTFELNIADDFTPNKYLERQGEKIVTKRIDNRSDPYMTSNFDVNKVMKVLSQEKSRLNYYSFFVLLFISCTVFLAAFYQKIYPKAIYPYVFIMVFILILITPFFVKKFNVDIKPFVDEKRELSKEPLEITKNYPREFELYYNDNFGLRNLFVNWNSKLKLNYFKVSPNPKLVLFGKNGFMFYNRSPGDIYASYSNSNLYKKKKLDAVYRKQMKIKKTLNSKGIKYFIGFYPNKHTVYDDLLPFSMKMQIVKDTTLADQLVAYFNSKKFPIIDVREDLISVKNKNQLYYKFDTHWNSYGAYNGYKSFCKQTFDELKLTPFDISDFNITYDKKRHGDLTNMIGISEMESYYDNSPNFILKNKNKGYKTLNTKGYPARTIVTENENCGNQLTLLVYRDSYTTALVQFLSLHFKKVIYIWSYAMDMNFIDKVNPDVVVFNCVERYIKAL